MTLLWHPDPVRIGDVAPIAARTQVSRVEPEFGPPGARPVGPLGDRHVSRRPVVVLAASGDGVTVARGEAAEQIRLDGAVLTGSTVLDAAALDRGAVLELEGRIAILVHRRVAPRPAAPDHGLIGASDAIEDLREAIAACAASAAPTLVCGETGTGKELVARAIHRASARRDGPFVAVNLAALPAAVAVAQLFGHRKGAFTGAVDASAGYFRAADGGTLFLDEVGAAALDVQAMLLRALEQHEIQPIGEPAVRVDVRMIAATDADLAAAVRAGGFREALLYRLAGLSIATPALRDRPDDVARLLLAFLREELAALGAADRLRARSGDEALWLPAGFVAAACRQRWPGNVRELRNLGRRLAVAHHGVDAVALETLGGMLEVAAPPPEREAVDDARIVEALEANGWQIGRTAAELKISRTTLYAVMERSGRAVKARDLDREDIAAAGEHTGGDVVQMAAELRVSVRALKLRIRELGLPFR
jgi:two-component system nitrogen regulation response regulator GlnG